MMNEELVLDAKPIDWGHDLTLIQANLELDVDQRLAQAEAYADFAEALRVPEEPFRPRELLRVLAAHDVDFVVVGGMAGTARVGLRRRGISTSPTRATMRIWSDWQQPCVT